jgi:hypothetical protein
MYLHLNVLAFSICKAAFYMSETLLVQILLGLTLRMQNLAFANFAAANLVRSKSYKERILQIFQGES